MLAGFFSPELTKHQGSWLPCEVEALSIAASIRHFSVYIIQSIHHASVLTNSPPCILAYEKLCRGEFSCVQASLTVVSNYHVSVPHLDGSTNLSSDCGSRNASPCSEPRYQICKFVNQLEECVAQSISVKDI